MATNSPGSGAQPGFDRSGEMLMEVERFQTIKTLKSQVKTFDKHTQDMNYNHPKILQAFNFDDVLTRVIRCHNKMTHGCQVRGQKTRRSRLSTQLKQLPQ